ncbi:P-type ATPase [Multifurca ochricompacta]|uniref:Cation-transporting ATPase n=1 Tax=Multifurca ochricompacta TaxID=376703 RepID=A0AAD4QQW6_9AGAM|nr:P-type ATPase [Multifurca ochricompacta]
MDPGTSNYDYTEGASAIEISEAWSNSHHSRRDSQHSLAYHDQQGTMFDGPGHSVVPTSISRMSIDRPRSRRRSEDSQASRPPASRRRSSDMTNSSSQIPDDSALEEDIVGEQVPLRRGRRSPSPRKTGMFGGIVNLFGRDTGGDASSSRRRTSISQHSRTSSARLWGRHSEAGSQAGSDMESEGDDRWGYSSGEEDEPSDAGDTAHDKSPVLSERAFSSYPPSPTPSTSLPLLSGDQLFGNETRLDIDLEPLDPPPPGPPSRQTIYLADEDVTLRFVGYDVLRCHSWAWRLACVFSLGMVGLLGHWFPRIWLRCVAREKAFKELTSGFIVIESTLRDISFFPVRRIAYPYRASTVFAGFSVPMKANGNGALLNNAEDLLLENLLLVDHRYDKFALDPNSGLFSAVKDWRDHGWTGVGSVKSGLEEPMRHQRLTLFGPNIIDIEGKSAISLLVDEVIHPFYVFQIASIILWSLDDYYYYAFCIALISAVSIITTLIDTRKTISRMRELSRFTCPVSVFVDGLWLERDSSDLVPGDVINLTEPPLSVVPADMILLSGDAIVNESMLTGESVPVSKIPVKDEDLVRWREIPDVQGDVAKSFLYSGTKVVRIRKSVGSAESPFDRPALGLVTRTGFTTTKGSLVRSMLFPKPIGFKFYRDSIRFIMVLSGIAGLGFCASAVQFIKLGIRWHTILIRALDLITVVVPPALPATLSIGTSFALSRLRRSGIFCISPNRINVAGKINVCCFDKTGTLTEDGLDILGVRALDRHSDTRFGELLDNVYDLPGSIGREKATFIYALATCHQLKVVNGEVIGDPLDVKMFQFTKWMIEEGHVAGTGMIRGRGPGEGEARPAALVQTIVRPPGSAQFKIEDALRGGAKHAHFLEFGVIRTFEFVSQLRRMSVVVKRLRSTSMEIYVKGAPEVMADICDKNSFPDDYDDLLSYYTKRGYRVIAIAGKSVEGLSWLKAQRMKREQAESNLRFLGLIIFENKLKPGTAPAIQALRSAHLPCRMITGDNPLTAVSVAQECNLISQTAHVFAPAFVQGSVMTPLAKLSWSCMDDPAWKLDDYSLKPLTPPTHYSVDADMVDYQDYVLVITGDVFRWMINNAPLETLQRMLARCQIFARMSPDEKNEVVERLQAIGYTVLMCGDGANDCAALKAADVGLSLSEAEASVAAPFTSKTPDIGCVLEVIKEGRAALVTSFSCFKYMALYSLIQFTTITLLYSFASSLGDFQFLYIDLFVIIPIAVSMGRTLPYPWIHPKRPTASLVSRNVLTSIIGQIVITSAVQFWAFFWVRSQPWYLPTKPNTGSDDNHLQATNYENTVLFLLSCFQYILVAAVFSIGPPYRKPMWTNGLLMLFLVTLSLFNISVLVAPTKFVSAVLELMPIPVSARLTLLWVGVINVAVSVSFERWVAQPVADVIGIFLSRHEGRRRIKESRIYRAVDNRE